MTTRKLSLKKDTLTELTPAELAGVAGGDITTILLPSLQYCPLTGMYPTLPVLYCVTDLTQ